jgi:hypothetical protein
MVGFYLDKKGVNHGFLLHQGKYTVLGHPRAATAHGPGEEPILGTISRGINSRGDIVGTYGDSKGVSHG